MNPTVESVRARSPFEPRPLIVAAGAACAGALAAREGGAIGCALVVAALACATALGLRAGALVVAIPAALGALRVPDRPSPWPPAGPVVLDGTVAGRFARDTATGTLRFDVALAPGGARVRCQAPLRGRTDPWLLLPGDRVRGPAFLRDPDRRRDAATPPLADVELGALRIEPGPPSAVRLATAARLRLENALRAALPGEAGCIAAHLVLGSGPRLPDDLVDAHRATGLAHLLAVSGAHASILAWLLAAGYALARGRDPWQARAFRRGCAVLLFAYGAVTGFDPPVLRALVAWTVLAIAAAHGRRAGVASALAAPALVTALVAPDELLSVSFCLSYAAVVGLAAAGAFRRAAGVAAHARQALRASVWAMLATSPLTLWWFGQVAPWTILGTPLLAPLVAIMLALGVLTAVLGVVLPPLAALPAAPLGFLTDGYAAAVRTLADLPLAPVHATCVPTPLVAGAFALLAAAVVLWRPDRRRFGLACVIACVPHFVGPFSSSSPRVVVGDVGHGQAVVATLADGATVVVDCGALLDGGRAALAVEAALAPRRRIDLLVVSHGDADHTAGIPRLARRLPIGTALLPADLRGAPLARELDSRGVALRFVAPGEVAAPRAGVVVHAPAVRPGAPSNDRSLWTRIEGPDARVLLPGDAGTDGVRAALGAPGFAAPVDVLLLPHHGRGTVADADRLVDALRPAVCIASTGWPAGAALADRVRARGVPVLTTAEHGALDVGLAAPAGVRGEHAPRIGIATGRDRAAGAR